MAYHWSPSTYRESIRKHGLLVPKLHPKLTSPTVCSDGHRNPHISLGKTPADAWTISGGFLVRRAREQGLDIDIIPVYWDLWQVKLTPGQYRSNGYELQSRRDIRRSVLWHVGSRITQ